MPHWSERRIFAPTRFSMAAILDHGLQNFLQYFTAYTKAFFSRCLVPIGRVDSVKKLIGTFRPESLSPLFPVRLRVVSPTIFIFCKKYFEDSYHAYIVIWYVRLQILFYRLRRSVLSVYTMCQFYLLLNKHHMPSQVGHHLVME